ncbi:hypothetical protein [Teichococcus vastitatis]|uniref:Uncharacterized protein n=1 Tax=Teichococcus vastitatis TaxID=2307076 RepID=A0ABS9W3U4_9PROT|nr:hypothetical protein [Pseudoroseomonas vastitatis]MCI0753866.1 hypothetical protein [Pseudoroseomonas vastitatis]
MARTTTNLMTSSLALGLQSSGTAVGEDTFTSVDISLKAKATGAGGKVQGTITSTAAAYGDGDGYVAVQNYVDPGDANFVKIKTTNVASTDGSYEQSITTFTIKNKAHGPSKHTESVKSVTIEDPPAVVSGNAALISIDAVAQGEDSLMDVQAAAFALEDRLSESSVEMILRLEEHSTFDAATGFDHLWI